MFNSKKWIVLLLFFNHSFLFCSMSEQIHQRFRWTITEKIPKIFRIHFEGQLRRLNGLMVSALLPSTSQFITYQGSLPFPACHETVTWIVLNQAVIITEAQVSQFFTYFEVANEHIGNEGMSKKVEKYKLSSTQLQTRS